MAISPELEVRALRGRPTTVTRCVKARLEGPCDLIVRGGASFRATAILRNPAARSA